jgi:hypothetical protein
VYECELPEVPGLFPMKIFYPVEAMLSFRIIDCFVSNLFREMSIAFLTLFAWLLF